MGNPASKIIISGLLVVSGLLAHQLKLQMAESERLRAVRKTQTKHHTRIIKRLMDAVPDEEWDKIVDLIDDDIALMALEIGVPFNRTNKT